MAEGKGAFLRTLFKSWWVRIVAALAVVFALINGYAGVQDQFESLPKLQEILPVPHLGFLPWWGWLLVWLYAFLAVFVYALFEYVRVKMPGALAPAPLTPLTGAQPPAPAKKSRRDILGPWAHVDIFKVSDAACLWAGHLPGGSYEFDKMQKNGVVGAERLISTELDNVLDTRDVGSFDRDMQNAYVTRANLLALAERKGVKPGFLYPDG